MVGLTWGTPVVCGPYWVGFHWAQVGKMLRWPSTTLVCDPRDMALRSGDVDEGLGAHHRVRGARQRRGPLEVQQDAGRRQGVEGPRVGDLPALVDGQIEREDAGGQRVAVLVHPPGLHVLRR